MTTNGELTLTEAGRLFNRNPSGLRKAIQLGKLEATRRETPQGGYWVVTRAAMEAYQAAHPARGPRKDGRP